MTAQITERERATAGAHASAVDATAGSTTTRRSRNRWSGVATYGGYGVLQLLQLYVLHLLAPRFFWFDDSQTQFGPMAWWMGEHLQGGRPPLMDADQGMAGNLTADAQYGALDPLHWALQALGTRTDDLLFMSWGFAAICVLGLGLGTLVLLRSHGVRPVLAVAGALGVASSGFFLWYGGAWWPLMWSVAWLPWFWWGLSARRWWAPAVLGVATWGLFASGNPYVIFFLVVLVVAQLVERFRAAGLRLRGVLDVLDAGRIAGLVGGLLMAMPTLSTMLQSSQLVSRQAADPTVGNIGFGVTNLADVLLGSPTLMGQTNAWGGELGLVPGMATLLFAVAALALVDWKRAIRARGVLTAAAVTVAAVVFTQLPTTVAVFRYPVRYLVIVQVSLPVLALLALAAAPLLTRRRVWLAFGLVAAQAVLAEFRAPVFAKWHLLAAVLTALALAALLTLLRPPTRRPLLGVAAVLLVVLPWGTVFIGERMMVSLQERMDALNHVPDLEQDQPYRALYPGQQLGTAVGDYRAHSIDPGGSATVLSWDFGGDGGWSGGVFRGNGNLIADFDTGTGSFAVWQKNLNQHWCRTYQGATCGDPQWLLDTAPGTGTTWIDLLSQDTVYVDSNVPQPLQEHFQRSWTQAGQAGRYTEYTRDDGLPGRVTYGDGVTVAQGPVSSGMAYGDAPLDSYRVTTGTQPGTLAFRITYWPGMTATLDGRDLPVSTVDGAVVEVRVPAGTREGLLELSFQPIGQRILVPALAAGTVVILGAAVVGLVGARRRPRPAIAGSVGAASGRGAAPAEAGGHSSEATGSQALSRSPGAGLRQLLHFLLGSCMGLAVDLSTFAVAVHLGAPPWLANTVSAGCAVVVVYLFVTKYAFRTGRSQGTFLTFVAWYVTSILLFSFLIEVLHQQTGWAAFSCKLLSLPFSFAANFTVSKVLFRDRSQQGANPGIAVDPPAQDAAEGAG
jgi:hypothetical protein